jgi:hypothetical protein
MAVAETKSDYPVVIIGGVHYIKLFPTDIINAECTLKPGPYAGPIRHHKKGRARRYK